MEYSIGDVAERFGLSVSQLRFYDREGLFPGLERKNGIRKFNEPDIETLNLIECLKQSGLEIREIKQFVEWTKEGDSTIELRKEFFERQREKVLAEIDELKRVLDVVDFKCHYYEKAYELGSCDPLMEDVRKYLDEAVVDKYEKAKK